MNTPLTPLQNLAAPAFPGQSSDLMTERNSTRTEHAGQRIAHIDDDPDIRDTVKRILHVNGYAVESYQTMRDFTT
ncbi:MAG TPA: hypothetical protein VFI43_00950, partial [Nitrosospira sp.]|nr:hypothetical protein [Nitrosospira sp.]